MSTADAIADLYNNDGQNWENDGQNIEEAIEAHEAHVSVMRLDGGKRIHTFRDGSMMFLCDDWWDVVTVNDDGRFIDSNGDDVSPLT